MRVIWSRRRPSKPAASVVRTSLKLCGSFLHHRARQRAGERRIIPAREPGIDIADIAAHRRAASPPSRRSTVFGYSVVCLLPEKRSSSLLTISRGPFACVTSTSARPELCVPGGAEAGEIDRLARARACRGHARSAHRRIPSRAGEIPQPPWFSRASQRAKRNPAPPSLGCRGPIRMFGFNLSDLWG